MVPNIIARKIGITIANSTTVPPDWKLRGGRALEDIR
jgi:hypothetical protein